MTGGTWLARGAPPDGDSSMGGGDGAARTTVRWSDRRVCCSSPGQAYPKVPATVWAPMLQSAECRHMRVDQCFGPLNWGGGPWGKNTVLYLVLFDIRGIMMTGSLGVLSSVR